MLGRRKLSQPEDAKNAMKKKKWRFELELECEENLLQFNGSDNFEEPQEINTDDSLEKDDQENSIVKKDDKDNIANPKNSENEPSPEENKKKKRYAWMDSDDEDILSSSEDESLENITSSNQHPIDESTNLSSDNSNLMSGFRNQLPTQEGNRQDTNINPTKPELSNISTPTDETRYVYVSNISWEATITELSDWIQKLSKQSIIQIHTQFELANSYHHNSKGSHTPEYRRRVIIELDNHQTLSNIIRLNQKFFMGRPLRISQVYKKNGKFIFPNNLAKVTQNFNQQGHAHTRTFHKPFNPSKSMDGGYNWAS